MYIVFFVAGIAIGRSFTVFFLDPVAVLALHFYIQVPALQLKIGFCMVKFFGIEYHYTGIAALVVGMAFLAFFFFQPAMEPLAVQGICSHFLVAILAQFGLRILVKLDMALGALGFKFCVPFDHFSGHQQGRHIRPCGAMAMQ